MYDNEIIHQRPITPSLQPSDGNTLGGPLHPLIYANTSYTDKASQTIFRLAMLGFINDNRRGGC